ncbi:MAG TPA: molybdate ABC transporter substrate-binding protein [Nitrospiria bacterium]|nr:molybdate ABC transporter substrate-binding protein [Candidatus Manganitrophaceae bacterium]HIL34753.1 molybdate ABC transporter substrate-binding protein [Candidatus Manganitrophaceae bacterium]
MRPSRIAPVASLWMILILGLIIVGPLLEPRSLYGQSAKASGKTLLIAAASNLRFAMNEIVDEFGKAFQAEVKVAYGSSGSFTAQLMAGAPFDLFFSADEALPQKLISKGLALEDTLYRYGTGQIVLWVANRSPIRLEKDGMKALLHPSVHKIAIANPRHAPYGAAAVAALQNAGLYEGLRSRLVFGENISEAAHFVRAGSAEIGILSYAHAIGSPLKESGRFWPIPTSSYPPLNQATIILGQSRNVPLSKSFVTFMIEGLGREIMERNGYQTQGHSG